MQQARLLSTHYPLSDTQNEYWLSHMPPYAPRGNIPCQPMYMPHQMTPRTSHRYNLSCTMMNSHAPQPLYHCCYNLSDTLNMFQPQRQNTCYPLYRLNNLM